MTAAAADEPPVCLPPRPMGEPAARLPPGTCDCHFHVIAPGVPFAMPRSYTPHFAPLRDWQNVADALGIEFGVLVQPSVYGFDNRMLISTLAASAGRLSGIAVLPPDTTDAELRRLDDFGVRGVRINIRNMGGLALDDVPAFAERLAPLGWHMEFQVEPVQLDILLHLADDLPLPTVIDHAGFVPLGTAAEVDRSAKVLQRLLERSDTYVKLSAPYRLAATPYAGFGELAQRLAETHPEQLLWGSDWPHTELFDTVPDDAELAALTLGWLTSQSIRQSVFVTNPAKLYRRDN